MMAHGSQPIAYVDAGLQALLATSTVVLFALWFANVPTYLNLVVFPQVTQLHWLYLGFALVTLLAASRNSWETPLNGGLVIWWIATVGVHFLWYLGWGGGEVQVFLPRIAALVFLATTYFSLASSPQTVQALRKAIAIVVAFSVALNIFDLLQPFVLVPAGHEFAHFGRAAGIYVNPNQAGAAIVMGLVLSLGVVPARLRGLFVMWVALGVLLTLSRAAILSFALVVAGLTLTRDLPRRAAWQLVGFTLVLLIIAGTLFWSLISDAIDSGVLRRLMWFSNPGELADFSQNERAYLAEQGLNQFLAHPLLGNGIGSTESWGFRSSTHNQYLQYMSDFGITGALILPVLLLTFALGTRPGNRSPLIVAIYISFWGLFSHNILTEYYWLVGVSLAAALSGMRSDAAPPQASALHVSQAR